MCVLCCTAVNVIYTRLTCRVQQKCDLYSATRSCHCNILTRQKVTQFIATKAMGIMPDMAIHMTSFVYKTAWLEMCKTEAAADLSCWSWQFCQFIMAGDQLCWYNNVSWGQLRNQFCSLQCRWHNQAGQPSCVSTRLLAITSHSMPQLMQTRLTSMQWCTECKIELPTSTCGNAKSKSIVSVTAELASHWLAADAHNVSEVV